MEMRGDEQYKVSVIIPSYNRIDYIGEAIDSVLNQTYPASELIVVDDGSTDGSYEYLQGLAQDGKIQLLSHPGRANKGQSAALNLGLEQAQGDFIAILDSDDVFELNKLELQVNYFRAHPDVGIVYGDATAIDGEGNFLYDIDGKFSVDPSDPNEVLLDCYFSLPVNSLVRVSAYEKAGNFNEKYRAAQDHDMLIRLAEVAKIGYINEKVFKYRRHGASISSNGQITRWANGFEILEQAITRFPYKSTTIRKRKAVLHFRLGLAKLKSANKLGSLKHLILSAIYDPVRAIKVVFRVDKSSFSS